VLSRVTARPVEHLDELNGDTEFEEVDAEDS
jgi:hypothetical protein